MDTPTETLCVMLMSPADLVRQRDQLRRQRDRLRDDGTRGLGLNKRDGARLRLLTDELMRRLVVNS